jgi:hypothetical protein
VARAQGLKVCQDEMDSKMLIVSVGVVNLLRESGRGIVQGSRYTYARAEMWTAKTERLCGHEDLLSWTKSCKIE